MQNVDGLQHEDMDMVQADYMEGLKIVREHYPHENVSILWLGSSVGNLSASAVVQFFRDAVAAVDTHCQILLCADMWKDQEHLRAAHYDKVGATMACAMRLLYWVMKSHPRMRNHGSMKLASTNTRTKLKCTSSFQLTLSSPNTEFTSGERVLVEVSRKFTVGDFNHLANESGEHLQAFAKLKLLPNEVATKFDVMFALGIDPIVTEPSKCHGHPEVPVQWPTCEEIIEDVQHVREDLMEAMDDACIRIRPVDKSGT
ncbi:unnamed protein product [Sphagnum compactum]